MTQPRWWDPAIMHCGSEAEAFVRGFFSQPGRKVLFVAGAGFDPRATHGCNGLAAVAPQADAVLVREERPNPAPELVRRAEENLAIMQKALPQAQVKRLDVFAPDGAIVGGRAAVLALRPLSLLDYSDVVIDLSALSIGIAYPMVRYLHDQIRQLKPTTNLHVLVTDQPVTDDSIVPEPSDRVDTVHGFQGGLDLDEHAHATRLWLPQLVKGKRAVLERIRADVEPHDVCPILPFPARNPRLADELIEHYSEEFESTWEVDARSIVYADQQNPLDLYRSVLRIAEARQRVYAQVGGSLIILSPLGSKALALGAMMAAIERNFTVVYVEAISYTLKAAPGEAAPSNTRTLIQVWLT